MTEHKAKKPLPSLPHSLLEEHKNFYETAAVGTFRQVSISFVASEFTDETHKALLKGFNEAVELASRDRLGIVDLDRYEGGFQVISSDPYYWEEANSILKGQGHTNFLYDLSVEEYGPNSHAGACVRYQSICPKYGKSVGPNAKLVTLVAYENCPWLCMLMLYYTLASWSCLKRHEVIQITSNKGFPEETDAVWYGEFIWPNLHQFTENNNRKRTRQNGFRNERDQAVEKAKKAKKQKTESSTDHVAETK